MTAPRLERRPLEGCRAEVHLAYPHEGQGPEPSQVLRIAHFPDNSWSSCPADSVQPTGAAQTVAHRSRKRAELDDLSTEAPSPPFHRRANNRRSEAVREQVGVGWVNG